METVDMTHPTPAPRPHRPRIWPAITAAAAAAAAVLIHQLAIGSAPSGPLALALAGAAVVPLAAVLRLVWAHRAYAAAVEARGHEQVEEVEKLRRRIREMQVDHDETIVSIMTRSYGYKLEAAAAAERAAAADPVLHAAVETYAPGGVLTELPSIRDLKTTLQCGQPTAARVQAYLKAYPEQVQAA
jgi:hypothetical protein